MTTTVDVNKWQSKITFENLRKNIFKIAAVRWVVQAVDRCSQVVVRFPSRLPLS